MLVFGGYIKVANMNMYKILFLVCVVIVSGPKFINLLTLKRDGKTWYVMGKYGGGRLDWYRYPVDGCPLSKRFLEDNTTVYRFDVST